MNDNTIQFSNAHLFDHDCRNYAVATDNGDGTATVIEVQNCTSCWQVGHDSDHEYMRVGQVVVISDRKDEVIE